MYTITENTKTELERLIAERPGSSGGTHSGSTGTRQVIWVRTHTGPTSVDRADVQVYDSSTGTYETYDAVDVVILNPDTEVTRGNKRYLGINHGDSTAGETQFVVKGDDKRRCFEVVTDIQCVDGALQVTKRTLWLPSEIYDTLSSCEFANPDEK
jgi:hypothetical protein